MTEQVFSIDQFLEDNPLEEGSSQGTVMQVLIEIGYRAWADEWEFFPSDADNTATVKAQAEKWILDNGGEVKYGNPVFGFRITQRDGTQLNRKPSDWPNGDIEQTFVHSADWIPVITEDGPEWQPFEPWTGVRNYQHENAWAAWNEVYGSIKEHADGFFNRDVYAHFYRPQHPVFKAEDKRTHVPGVAWKHKETGEVRANNIFVFAHVVDSKEEMLAYMAQEGIATYDPDAEAAPVPPYPFDEDWEGCPEATWVEFATDLLTKFREAGPANQKKVVKEQFAIWKQVPGNKLTKDVLKSVSKFAMDNAPF